MCESCCSLVSTLEEGRSSSRRPLFDISALILPAGQSQPTFQRRRPFDPSHRRHIAASGARNCCKTGFPGISPYAACIFGSWCLVSFLQLSQSDRHHKYAEMTRFGVASASFFGGDWHQFHPPLPTNMVVIEVTIGIERGRKMI